MWRRSLRPSCRPSPPAELGGELSRERLLRRFVRRDAAESITSWRPAWPRPCSPCLGGGGLSHRMIGGRGGADHHGAGTGAVLLLRWYWWRINAWSEVSAMVTAFVVSLLLQTWAGLKSDRPRDFAYIVLITVAVTTVVWLASRSSRVRSRVDARRVLPPHPPSRTGWGPVAPSPPTCARPRTPREPDRLGRGLRAGVRRVVRRGQAPAPRHAPRPGPARRGRGCGRGHLP